MFAANLYAHYWDKIYQILRTKLADKASRRCTIPNRGRIDELKELDSGHGAIPNTCEDPELSQGKYSSLNYLNHSLTVFNLQLVRARNRAAHETELTEVELARIILWYLIDKEPNYYYAWASFFPSLYEARQSNKGL